MHRKMLMLITALLLLLASWTAPAQASFVICSCAFCTNNQDVTCKIKITITIELTCADYWAQYCS